MIPLYLITCIFYACLTFAEGTLSYTEGDSTFDVTLHFQPEVVYARNINWLANDNIHDAFFYARHYLDGYLSYSYGKQSYDYEVCKTKIGIRNRTIWGATSTALTTTIGTIKDVEVLNTSHRHGLWLNDLWIRELWLELALSDFLGLSFCNRHLLTIGAFCFELGRGISLGSAYPNFPVLVGVDVETAIDQYAFGAKLSGDLCPHYLTYDFYGAIFRDRTLEDDSEFGVRSHQFNSAHGWIQGNHCSNALDFVCAARLKGEFFGKDEQKRMYCEPYILLHYDPELKIEFCKEAKSTLVTIGIAGEWFLLQWEFGFECAFNRGGQQMFGIDRNRKSFQDHAGALQVAYSEVEDITTDNDALVTEKNEKIVSRSLTSEAQNGHFISPQLKNKPFRFQDPYTIKYRGHFFVADVSYICIKDRAKVSGTVGYATGDNDAHKRILEDQHYKKCDDEVTFWGFIPVNETYTGKRVVSVFFLNGTGAFPRPITFGSILDSGATLVGGFTNLVFTGASVDLWYKVEPRRWHTMFNVLFFWQEHCAEREGKAIPAYLGTEINCIADFQALKDLSFFVTAGLFVPGACYTHLDNVPLTSEQKEAVKEHKSTVLVGDDLAYFINFGLKYAF